MFAIRVVNVSNECSYVFFILLNFIMYAVADVLTLLTKYRCRKGHLEASGMSYITLSPLTLN